MLLQQPSLTNPTLGDDAHNPYPCRYPSPTRKLLISLASRLIYHHARPPCPSPLSPVRHLKMKIHLNHPIIGSMIALSSCSISDHTICGLRSTFALSKSLPNANLSSAFGILLYNLIKCPASPYLTVGPTYASLVHIDLAATSIFWI
jgi:hypothetical protein